MNIRTVQLPLLICFFSLACGGMAVSGEETPADLLRLADAAFAEERYLAAGELYLNASAAFAAAGDDEMRRDAFRKAKRAGWILGEFPLNRTSAGETIASEIPVLTPQERDSFLEPGESIQIRSDGETWYYEGIARNIRYHNLTLIRDSLRSGGVSPFYDQILPLIKTEAWKPHTFIATGTEAIPRSALPESGLLQVWIPLPVETESQTNITVLSVEPAEYVVSGPVTTGNLGEVYLEIPLGEMEDEWVNISVKVAFTTSPRISAIDPDTIGAYDTGSDLYQRYTASQPSIHVSPEIEELASRIVGDETNPGLKAARIYEYIISTIPYSNVPHSYLAAAAYPESDFVHETGFGDCGTQSAYFAALCRAEGIPARACGGYQIVPGYAGTHFWAEYYLPGYGWQPVDVTVAEAGDWAFNATEEDRTRYKEFFLGNLDPYRCTLQTDMDENFSEEPGPDILMTLVHQNPAVICTTADSDIEMLGMLSWSLTFEDITL